MASATFGPVGALYRGTVRRMAFNAGLICEEQKSLVDSMFRVTGDATAVISFSETLRRLVEELEEDDRQYEAALAARKAERKAAKRWWKPSTWFD